MKKIFFAMASICLSNLLLGQQISLKNFNIERQQISNTGIKILCGYAATNIIYGSIAASKTTGSNKYFNEMNAIWNGITLGITGIGFLTVKKEGQLSYAESLKKQQNIEKLFLFNAGLDVAYIAGGAYLKERSKTTNKSPVRINGYGESVMLQGAVLLLFDGFMYGIQNKHGKILTKMFEKIELAATQNGLGILVKL